ncbi:MAG: phosphotransacetylase family protein [Planctomycetes bacterium]|nr:phosphotransacetylase family protein [Planctomycetota bacterium]
MQPLLVGSLSRFAGKNLICLGFARRFEEDGLTVGFFKPIGLFPMQHEETTVDADAVFFRKVLRLKEAPADLCPVVMTDALVEQALDDDAGDTVAKVDKAFKKVSKDKDVVLVDGTGDLNAGTVFGVSEADIIRKYKAKVVMVDRWGYLNQTLDGFLGVKRALKSQLAGVVINRVPQNKRDFVLDRVGAFLKKNEVDLLGVLPEDVTLNAVSVKEILDCLGAELILGRDKLSDLIERYQIGAMSVESALVHFRRVKNKAVVIGGDRPDMHLAAMETNTKLLVLTGGVHPNEIILSRADANQVAVMVTKEDTQATVERLESLLGYTALRNENKVKAAVTLVNNAIDFQRLYDNLGFEVL